ncbi:MAG: hypothetical protein LC674_04180 [Actinobacteria bacterium]|nr:hypothetical protein [Actinomycetota bacterium]
MATLPIGSSSDPAFASAVEHAYLRELKGVGLEPSPDLNSVHSELLAQALRAADPTNGGLRLRKLENASELEDRLRRSLDLHING